VSEIGRAQVVEEASALLGAGAAILEQIALRPVGLGVAEHSTTLTRSLDRLRTTLTYVYVLALGTPEEQRAVARMVDRVHARVRSVGRYDARDPELQLWVGATLAREGVRVHEQVFGPMSDASRDRVLRESSSYATALQVPAERWPVDAQAFDDYWAAALQRLEPDPVVRSFARRLLSTQGQPVLVRALLPLQSLMARGGVPPEVREVLGLPWTPRDQGAYDLFWKVFPPLYRRVPRPLRVLPARLYLHDFRRRLRRGQRVI
jgi:uncharacterized protein (DUF2236 family)